MKKEILCLLIVFMLGFLTGQTNFKEYYKIDLNYDKGEFELINLEIEFSDKLIENNGFYTAGVLDYNKKILNLTLFDVPNKVLYDETDENGTIIGGGERELEEVNFTIYVPYYKNATKVIIYDRNLDKKLEIDVGFYSKDYQKYDMINKNVSNEEKSNNQKNGLREGNVTKEETFIEKISSYWWILLIILIILLVILIIYIKK